MSEKTNIPFSPPRLDEKSIEAVAEVLRSGWITTGPKTKLFEKKITEYCGNQKTLCISSATDGLFLTLKWLGVGEGDEVIVPAYTYTATANVVIHCGAKPIIVDVGEDFNLSIDAVKKAITSKTKAIIPVDIGGLPCNYSELNQLVKSEQVTSTYNGTNKIQQKLGRPLLLADSAHSIGAEYNGEKTGSLCDITVFSFHAVKNLTTAEGGAVCINLPKEFNAEEVYNWMNTMSLHGQNKDALAKQEQGGWKYDVPKPGYKCNMTDIQAAIGLVELERYQTKTLTRRKEIFELYSNLLKIHDWAILPTFQTEIKQSSYHAFMLRINGINEEKRDMIIQQMSEKGIATNVHFQPLPLLSYYRDSGYDITDYPNAYKLYSNEISLPVYYDLTNEAVELVVSELINTYDSFEY